jgi:hypothetical protein
MNQEEVAALIISGFVILLPIIVFIISEITMRPETKQLDNPRKYKSIE